MHLRVHVLKAATRLITLRVVRVPLCQWSLNVHVPSLCMWMGLLLLPSTRSVQAKFYVLKRTTTGQ